MKHIHLKSCSSTQLYLSELKKDSHTQYLISTNHQKSGFGRRERAWDSREDDSLCFSFTLREHNTLTLTSAELSVLLCTFFKNQKIQLQVKWPNDILNKNEQKCGGVLIQKTKEALIVGIGLNMNPIDYEEYSIQAGSIFENKQNFSCESLSLEIYQYILENRLSSQEVKERWLNLCAHGKKMVTITEDGRVTKGIFKEIGDFGEAIITTEYKEVKSYNGTLRF